MGSPLDTGWLADVGIEPAEQTERVQHHCFSDAYLRQLWQYVTDAQQYHQDQAEQMAKYRQGIVLCLHDHHHLSYVDTGERLGITGSRAEQIAKGKH